MAVLPVLLLAAGGAMFWQSGRINGEDPETDEILRLREEKKQHSSYLNALSRKLAETIQETSAQIVLEGHWIPETKEEAVRDLLEIS